MYRGTQKFCDTLRPMGEGVKRILTYLCSTKYNEINICPLDTQRHVYIKRIKIILIA